MRNALIVLRGLLWGTAIGVVAGALYGIVYLAVFGMLKRERPWGRSLFLGAPLGAEILGGRAI